MICIRCGGNYEEKDDISGPGQTRADLDEARREVQALGSVTQNPEGNQCGLK